MPITLHMRMSVRYKWDVILQEDKQDDGYKKFIVITMILLFHDIVYIVTINALTILINE